MLELENFIRLSKFAGERFDLVQAGGGNTSVKKGDGTMLIKASGYLLSEVSEKNGYAVVDNKRLLEVFENETILNTKDKRTLESLSKEMIDKTIVTSSTRPSIETLLHALLQKYVLHTHPVVVNAITCRKDWKTILSELYPDSVLVDYFTPGIELALGMKKEIETYKAEHKKLPSLIFLQNHGIIVSSDRADEIYALYDEITSTLASYLKINLDRYKLTNKISALINAVDNGSRIAYLSEDHVLNTLLKKKRSLFFASPFCPDTFVFCGISPVEIKDTSDKKSIADFIEKYGEPPKVVLYKECIFFVSIHLRKAREMEDVFKFHVSTADAVQGNIQSLPLEELRYLGNWEAEKYRQKL